MRLVFLSSEMAHQVYLINYVNSRYPVACVFMQPESVRHLAWHERLKKLRYLKGWRIYGRETARRLLFSAEARRQLEYERSTLFPAGQPRLDASIPVEYVRSFNEPEGVERVRRAEPDIIVVFGTDILRGEILNVARVDILNIHRSILPRFRGGGMPYWTFYENAFDDFGTTIHRCIAKLDAGDIIAQRRYRIAESDRIHMLRARTTVLSAELLVDVLESYEKGRTNPQPQTPSPLYRSSELTIGKEIVARYRFARHVARLRRD